MFTVPELAIETEFAMQVCSQTGVSEQEGLMGFSASRHDFS